MKAGRKKQAIKRGIHSIKVSPFEYNLVKRFIKLLRDGGQYDIVLNTVDELDICDGGVLPAPDGSRNKTTISAYADEWGAIQKFIKAIIRCCNEERSVVVDALDKAERFSVDGDFLLIVVDGDNKKIMVGSLEKIRLEFARLVENEGDDPGVVLASGMYNKGEKSLLICSLTRDKYITI